MNYKTYLLRDSNGNITGYLQIEKSFDIMKLKTTTFEDAIKYLYTAGVDFRCETGCKVLHFKDK